MKKSVLYIHGKGGQAEEAEHYKVLFPDYDVIGLDYKGQTLWETKKELLQTYRQLNALYEHIDIIANSIGAYFAMNALSDTHISRAFFISPIVDMEKLIKDMMQWAGVTEDMLEEKKEIKTAFGETLSWEYLRYVRENPIMWNVPTDILYGKNDNLTAFETISSFAENHNATLTVMQNGEHWFHTEEQMQFLDRWLKQCLRAE